MENNDLPSSATVGVNQTNIVSTRGHKETARITPNSEKPQYNIKPSVTGDARNDSDKKNKVLVSTYIVKKM